MPCEYFLLIRRQRRPCLLAIDDGLSLAGQHEGHGHHVFYGLRSYYIFCYLNNTGIPVAFDGTTVPQTWMVLDPEVDPEAVAQMLDGWLKGF